MAAIQTSGLTKDYASAVPIRRARSGVVRALEDLSLEVRDGELFGFLGPNGAGKTTMIRLLLGFLHPTAGQATVLGLDSAKDSVEIRRRVGYLPGGIALYDGMTGEHLLEYLADLYGRSAPKRAELLDRMEFSQRDLRRLVRDYSRGMRQKIGIVQALQHDPELAILDEPTEGLDPLMQHAFYTILDDLRGAGRTIFFSSHVLPEVERVCDRVAIIRLGRLAALEDVTSLLAKRKRNVEMRLAGPAPHLQGIQGVSGIAFSDGLLRCHLEGDVRPFLRAIEGAEISDLTIEPAHLEEAFLEFYAADLGLAESQQAREAMGASATHAATSAPQVSATPDRPTATEPIASTERTTGNRTGNDR